MNKIQVIYQSGTFGNLLRWLIDKFSLDTKITSDVPWDIDNRVHGEFPYNNKFILGHCVWGCEFGLNTRAPDDSADKIIINYAPPDLLFAERCGFYRMPGYETEQSRYNKIIAKSDKKFLQDSFNINQNSSNKFIAKELFKIQLHSDSNEWWKSIRDFMNNKKHYQFPITAFFTTELLSNELEKVSNKFKLNLELNYNLLDQITDKISNMYVIKTKDRAKQTLSAIKNNENINCSDLDIFEDITYKSTTFHKFGESGRLASLSARNEKFEENS